MKTFSQEAYSKNPIIAKKIKIHSILMQA